MGYNAELLMAFLILVHYTDLDLAELDTPQGRYTAYDAIATHGLWEQIHAIVDEDLNDVKRICDLLTISAQRRFEMEHSPAHILLKTFSSFLGTEDLMQTIAKAEGLNGKLIEMLAAVQKEKKPAGGVNFAKKQDM